VLESYDSQGQAWKRASRGKYPLHLNQTIAPVDAFIRVQDESAHAGKSGLPQTFYIERPLTVEIPVSYPVQEIYFPARGLQLTATGTVRSPYGLRRGVTYGAVSQLRDTSPSALRGAAPVPTRAERVTAGSDLDIDLALPDGIPPRVKRLGDQLTAGRTLEFDRVEAIVAFLRTNYRYSLDTPRLPTGQDAVDRFLFVDHVGFCEQFASTLTVLLREEGIPARLAVGYASGDHDALTGTFTVRARDAHAWVEVLFPGVGWVPFDASPGFDSTPVAGTPQRWFLSDLQLGLPLASVGSIGGRQLGSAAAGIALLAVLSMIIGRRRHQPAEVRRYLAAQRWLSLGRLPSRSPSQTPTEHLEQLSPVSPAAAAALEPLARALEEAIFGGRRGRGPRTSLAVAASTFRYRVQRRR
jgi:transglutaminase-like putative cysteine protease